MTTAGPRVFLLACTAIEESGVGEWLASIGGTPCLEHVAGSDPERLIEFAARRCYRAYAPGLNPNVTAIRRDSEKYHGNILAQGHGSVLEHATATWAFEGVSRVFTHELVRNRIGNAFSQESLRYVRLTDGIPVWIPPEIADNEEAAAVFASAVERAEDDQRKLAAIYGIDQMTDFSTKKKLTSAFRRIAPDGLSTGIVFSCNMRSLRWIIEQRTSRHAEYEIRLVFSRVAEIAVERWPVLFQDFEPVNTGDGLVCEWVPKCHKV